MRHEKVDVIYQAAVEVFAECGFDQAKMDEIAQAAGVAKGTIYYHFDSKEELFVGLMNEGMDNLISCVRRMVEGKESSAEQMSALIEAHVRFFMQNGKLAKLVLSEAFGSRERQRQFRLKIREYLKLIETILRRGNETGEFSVHRPEEVASSIFGAVSVLALQKLYSMDEKEAEKEVSSLTESLRKLLLTGILNLSQN
jgi:AcrR family transcriptional regulator